MKPTTPAAQYLVERSQWDEGLRAFRVRVYSLGGPDDMERHLALVEQEARASVAPVDPFSVWQGVCGHLWRKVDTEDCPTCAIRALAEELGQHLERAIDDLIGDWDELGGPQMDYLGANDALSRLEKSR